MRTASLYQQAWLEHGYRAGLTARKAAIAAGVNVHTVYRYFRRFRFMRLPRAARPPNRAPAHGRFRDCPAYAGPDWIGKRA